MAQNAIPSESKIAVVVPEFMKGRSYKCISRYTSPVVYNLRRQQRLRSSLFRLNFLSF